MNQDKKNEVIDYSKFFERKKEKKVEGHEKRKRFSFGSFIDSFKDFWAETDKKTKIELTILLVIVASIIGILIFYVFQAKPKIPQYSQPAEEQFIPGEEEFE